jgi:hypothetical protein
MGIIYFILDLFIETVGITRPSPEMRRRAAFFILALLALAVAGAVAAFLVLRSSMN